MKKLRWIRDYYWKIQSGSHLPIEALTLIAKRKKKKTILVELSRSS